MTMWVIALLLGLAALLQFAVHAAPDIHDAPLKAKTRRVKIAALSLLCGYFGWAAFLEHWLHPWLLVGMLLSALAELGFAINRLFPGEAGLCTSQRDGTP